MNYVLLPRFERSQRMCLTKVTKVGVKVRNMKIDFNTVGTWRRVEQ